MPAAGVLREVKLEKNPNAREHAANDHAEADQTTDDASLAALAMRAAAGAGAGGSPPPPANGANGDSGTPVAGRVYLGMQQRFGNRAVQRMLAAGLQRAPAAGDSSTGVTTEPTVPRDPSIQRAGEKPVVSITGTSLDPSEATSKAAEIGIRHGSHEAVAWTTPNWTFAPAFVAEDKTKVTLSYELAFAIDLPSDYDKDKVEMLRQHEMGHVEIAKKKAKEEFDTKLKAKLEGITDIDKTKVDAEIRNALTAATAAEKAGSQAYDAAEYPLMIERYKGINGSLAELSKASGAIASAAHVLQGVPGACQRARLVGDPTNMLDLAQKVEAARGGLSGAEMARVQFNKAFQAIATAAKGAADELIASINMLPGVGEHHAELEPAAQKISAACGGFAFSAGGASAAY